MPSQQQSVHPVTLILTYHVTTNQNWLEKPLSWQAEKVLSGWRSPSPGRLDKLKIWQTEEAKVQAEWKSPIPGLIALIGWKSLKVLGD